MRRLALYPIVIGAALALFGVACAVQDPVVARYRVPVPGLARPLRIVQLSDIHASRFDMPDMRLRRIVAKANSLAPDLVVLTGDYISGYPTEWTASGVRAALAPLTALSAPLGIVAVLGNHDGKAMTRAAFAGTPVRLLISDSHDAGPVVIAGADDLLQANRAVTGLRRAIAAVPAGKPVIAIAHEPDFLQWLPPRAALIIAGHTHGGQIVLPLLGSLPRNAFLDAHRRGLYREHGQTLVVSSGLGTSVLPMRIGVAPEITEITLVPAYSVGRKSGTDR